MKHTNILFFSLSLLAVATISSCHKDDLFDKELYRYLVMSNYPVDTLESSHPWTLLRRCHVAVTAGVSDEGIREVRLYDADPTLGDGSQTVAQADIRSGMTTTVSYDMAQSAQNTMYAALVTALGTTYVTTFPIGQDSVSIGPGNVRRLSKMPSTAAQTFTYLFESSFPTPDDFDYNDVVLRISRKAPRTNQLDLTVTLAAAGCSKQVAGAIRLPGVGYDQVERVTISEGTPFDNEYPYAHTMIDASSDLISSRDGEAVIRLFEDAHWSLMKTLNELGMVDHQPCNTQDFAGVDTVAVMPPISRTYNIYFKEGVNADSLRLADLDPFIIEMNSNINFEVHTYQYKFQETRWQYMGDDKRAYDDYLAWALVIPDGSFRYSIETVPLGTYRYGELYGSYGRPGHSFGEWGRNYRVAYDWWQYPSLVLTY